MDLSTLARGDDLPEAVAVLARAFWRDPFFSAFSRDLLREYRSHPGFQRAGLVSPLATAGVRAARDAGTAAMLGVAGWVPPAPAGSARLRQAREALRLAPTFVRIRHRHVMWKVLTECARRHPPVPHWYLAVLGVDPVAQGRGVGAALVTERLADADSAGVPVYLETQKPENLAWYARFGFVQVGTVDVPGAPRLWLLERAPR
ncbi:MAG: GNAT family N-acetyltransferase [Actinomycetota bacterium]